MHSPDKISAKSMGGGGQVGTDVWGGFGDFTESEWPYFIIANYDYVEALRQAE